MKNILNFLIIILVILIAGQIAQAVFFSNRTILQQELIQKIHQSNYSNNQENNVLIPKLLASKWERKDILISAVLPQSLNVNEESNNNFTLSVQGIISGNNQSDKILILKNSDGIHYDYYQKGDTLPTGEKIVMISTKFVEVFQIVDNRKPKRKKIALIFSDNSNPLNSDNVTQ